MEKTGIDRNDQMVSYATTIRKSIKWYSKLALHLLLGTSIVNAHIVYQTATNKKIQIRKFREILVYQWCDASSENTMSDNHRKKTKKVSHYLEIRKNKQDKSIRRMYILGYEKKRQIVARQEARENVKKIKTYCSKCPKSPQMCLQCFNESTTGYAHNIYVWPDHRATGYARNIYVWNDHRTTGCDRNVYVWPDHRATGYARNIYIWNDHRTRGYARNIYVWPDHRATGYVCSCRLRG